MLTVHEPSSIRGDVGFLYREVQIRQNLYGFQKYSMFSSAVHLHTATRIEGERLVLRFYTQLIFPNFRVSDEGYLDQSRRGANRIINHDPARKGLGKSDKDFSNRNWKRRNNTRWGILEKFRRNGKGRRKDQKKGKVSKNTDIEI